MSILAGVLRRVARFASKQHDYGALVSSAAFRKSVTESAETLAAHHADYTANVSTPDMAVSLETASVLLALCRTLEPVSVLDLGSGFSSFTFRIYARTAKTECSISTADDDAAWLERTREFLERNGLDARSLSVWSELERRDRAARELVFHDLGRMPLRTQSLEQVLGRVAPGGLAVLDDVHKPGYAAHARSVCARLGFALTDLRDLTLDRFGRYAWLAVPGRGVR